ncbi:MAG: hypothetical protein WAU33_02035 [Candidatus Binataceae bacterium]|nr:hypothetical protein [Candidatus Binataceae bacterium]
MKNSILKLILAAAIVCVPLGGRVAIAGVFGSVRVVSTATFSEYGLGDPGTCNSTTFAPDPGEPVCIASIAETYTVSGDFVGGLLLETAFAEFANGSFALNSDFQNWTGSISGHGSGSFTLNEYDLLIRADGSYTSRLRILDGTGTGDFQGISGFGSSKGDLSSGVNTLIVEFPEEKHDQHR